MIRLTIREGATIRTIRWEADRVVIGAAPGVGVPVQGAGIQSRHCAVQAGRDGGAQVMDLGSTEGTILNGRRVTRSALRAGDVLTLGSSAVVIEEWTREETAVPVPTGGDAANPAADAATPDTDDPIGARTVLARGVPTPETFEEALYRSVRRSPPMFASLAVHVAVAALCTLFTPDHPEDGGGARSIRFADAGSDSPSLETELPSPDLTPPARNDAFEPVSPEESDSLLAGARDPALDDSPLAPSRESFAAPHTRDVDILGFGSRNHDSGESPVAPSFEGNPSFNAQASVGANAAASDLVARSMGGADRLKRRLAPLADSNLLQVVRGVFDHAEKVFALLDLSHETLSVAALDDASLDPRGLLLVACGDEHPSAGAVARVRGFVEQGGFLCTTDWGLESILIPAFPGRLRSLHQGPRAIATRNEKVEYRVATPSHPLVRGLRASEEGSLWWIEDSAFPVEVMAESGVTVLITSDAMKARYRSGILAVHFRHGKGQVLHLVGHAWQKEGNLKGAYGMQRILLNFLMERAATLPAGGASTSPAESLRATPSTDPR